METLARYSQYMILGTLSNDDGDAEDTVWLKMNLSFIHEFRNFLRVFGV